MNRKFFKYQGTGNDFILIDNRMKDFNVNTDLVARLCHRRFGIGADGLMLLQEREGYDFEMVYFNSDGNTSSMCGNGGRCIVAFANRLGIIKDRAFFLATDGPHEATISKDSVTLKMNDVNEIEQLNSACFLNTGSPHYVKFVKDIREMNVVEEGRKIRNSDRFKKEGTNVNFIEKTKAGLFVRTYERGVEDETFSCGTGVTAAALVAAASGQSDSENHCEILTPGGRIVVKFEKKGPGFTGIFLQGPAEFVFSGEIEL